MSDRRVIEGEWQRFTSYALPPYMRGLSTGDFREALPTLLREGVSPGLSPTVISRLTAQWQEEYRAVQRREHIG